LSGLTARRVEGAAVGRVRRALAGSLTPFVSTLLTGLLLAVSWRLFVPTVAGWSPSDERELAASVAYVPLAAVAGLAVAVGGLLRPGPGATARFLVTLAGSGLGTLVAWGVGRLLGVPTVTVPGVLLVWPVVTCLVTALVASVISIVHPLED
jgi:hypothetical protein